MLSTSKTLQLLAPVAFALVLLGLFGGLLAGWAAPLSYAGDVPVGAPFEPDLQRALSAAQDGETVRVVVYLREQADLGEALDGAQGAADARLRVVSALQAAAARYQAPLVSYLEGARAAGTVERYTCFWIVNAVAVQARPAAIRDLAARPEVATVRLDHYRRWLVDDPQPAISSQEPAWGIAQVRADEVWASLHISGTGTVVAGVDTGVDWQHPALRGNYRGYNPNGPANHIYSWHDATALGALYPVDDNGHGTHTMGSAVGQGGIGVAPGARWIAVKAFDNEGYAYDSWIHASFQWLLAPGGDIGMAPDVVNCSWGNPAGLYTVFQPDLRALRAAGIFAVFSNGNEGPAEGTVGSPASLPEAFAVGATDEYDLVANFSSRGPSPWGEIRPHVAAPGVRIRSSLPGGGYGLGQGTSMAAPHVTGIVALLHSVSPTLNLTRTAYILTSTAVPLGTPIPNNDTGWGRVDAFAAVAAVAHPGFITGTVTRAGDGTPVVGARVSAVPHVGGGGGVTLAADDGSYRLALAPAPYDLTVSAFGYASATVLGIVVMTDTVTVVDISLVPLPTGTLRGQIADAATGLPLTATVTVLDTPREAVTSSYAFDLPAGDYVVRARRVGYRVVTATVHVTAGQVVTADLDLPPVPTILLVDSGCWYNDSKAGYFRQALDDLAYAYDERPICRLADDVPAASDLAPYDVVVWTAPEDAPGYIGAHEALVDYLFGGGRLLLSGQDVGYIDDDLLPRAYYRDVLGVRLARDDAGSRSLVGEPGDLFAGLTLTITGAGGADNQELPDEIAVLDPDATVSVLAYQGAGCGGVRVGTCLDYRVVYLSFGFEAIDDRATRREVMDRALVWLVAEPSDAGLEVVPAAQTRVAPPGATVTHTLRVRHVGQAGSADAISLTLDGAAWPSQLSISSLALSPCTSATVVVTVTVPVTAAWDARDVTALTAHSTLSPALSSSAFITTKVPAPVLLVDDDIFFEQQERYEAALVEAGIPYDFWQTCPATGWCVENNPPLDVLRWYPIVVWWTGDDWYRPVSAGQIETLGAYLDGGGRLFLSSQDFLYYHHGEPFSREALGVLRYDEETAPTQVRGTAGDPIGEGLGSWDLDYPFENLADAVEPMPGTTVPFRDQAWRGVALARRADGRAAVFFAFPFEALPSEARPQVMAQTVGWLSWLGGSAFSADRDVIPAGGTLTYTLVLRNDGPLTLTASLSNTLPVSLTLVPGSLTGPAVYSATARLVSWEGALASGAGVTVTYRATAAAGLPAFTAVTNTALLGLEDQYIHFRRAAVVRVGAPDLAPSSLGCAPNPAQPGGVVTCTLAIVNGGLSAAPAAVVTGALPSGTTFVTGSLTLEGGGAAEALTDTLHWTGPLAIGARVTVTYQLILPTDPVHPPFYSVAFLEDGVGGTWERAVWVTVDPRRYYLPLVLRNGP